MKYNVNKETMKIENRRQILSLLYRQPMSRTALARETGLTQSAIGIIVGAFINEGIVVELGKRDDGALGRKPITLDINAGWGVVICISIDREGFEIGLTDLKGVILSEIMRIPYEDKVPAALDKIALGAKSLVERNGVPSERVIGAGVVVPGPVDAYGGRILNPPAFDPWHGLYIRDELEKRLCHRVFVQHNAGALAIAEYRFLREKGYNSFALLAINAGIGLGLILNGKAYTGASGLGCEIGHTSVDINGRRCACGNRGCLELYASTAAVLYDARRQSPEIEGWKLLVDKAWDGDGLCLELLDNQARYLAHSVINLNNLLELDAVVIAGLGAYRGALLLDKIRRQVQRRLLSKGVRRLRFEKTCIADHAMILAAGTVVTERLFEGGLYNEVVLHRPRKGEIDEPRS